MLALFVAASLVCGVVDGELERSLARLASPLVEDRREAERWLGAHVRPTDYPTLAEYLSSAELEPRVRITAALGADDRHFELARLMLDDAHDEIRSVGREVLRAEVVRWLGLGDQEEHVARDLASLTRLLRESAPPIAMRIDGATVDEALDRLARLADRAGARDANGRAITLVVAPELANAPALAQKSGGAPTVARWDAMIGELASRSRASIAVYGSPREHPWVLLAASPPSSKYDTASWIERWSHAAFASSDSGERERAARALAALAFPPALQALAAHWSATGDESLLGALALAAGRDWIAPQVCDARGARALFARAERALADGRRAALAEAARALVAIGTIGRDGSNPLSVAAEGFDVAAPKVRALRLAILARAAARVAALESWSRDRVARRPADAEDAELSECAFEYLAALPRDPQSAFAPADPSALFAAAERRGRAESFVEAWTKAELEVPRAWIDPAATSSVWEASASSFALRWHAALRSTTSARDLAVMLAAFLASEHDASSFDALLGESVESVALGLAPRLRAVYGEVRSVATDAKTLTELERLEVANGWLDDSAARALAKRCIAEGQLGETDWVSLGALAAGPEEKDVLAAFLLRAARSNVDDQLESPWVRGAEAAVLALRSAGHTESADAFLDRLRKVLPGAGSRVLAAALEARLWPAPPSRRPRDLDALDRREGI